MSSVHIPDASAFTAFNARSLSPEEVAATFVPPPHAFDALVSRDNSLLVGPRGSGKTTLLKMLHPAALSSWQHERADEYRAKIDYPGVFIPTDMAWNEQILGDYITEDEVRARLGMAAFTTHILTCLLDTIAYRLQAPPSGYLPLTLEEGRVTEFVKELAIGWNVDPALPTLTSLRAALSRRMGELGSLRNKLIHDRGDSETALDAPYMDMDPVASVLIAIETLGSISGRIDERWALLFDELELAPPGLRDFLMDALRSASARIVFKLSLTPHGTRADRTGETTPLPGHDFAPIDLTHPRKGTGYEFARRLLQNEINRRLGDEDGSQLSPDDVLGVSAFDASDNGDESNDSQPYGPNSEIVDTFRRLAEKDPSFQEYLADHDVDLDNLDALTANQRAAHVRKNRNLVVVRDYFRKAEQLRSRKSYDLFTGSSAVFALSEGNPRQFIGLVRPLLASLHDRDELPISRSDQAAAVASAVSRYISLLHTVPAVPSPIPGTGQVSLVSFLDVVGEYFRDRVLRDDFTANPPLMFTVDQGVPASMEYPLGQAWNAGAIVHVPAKDELDILPTLRGSKFRLSYLLAPRYSLPPRLGRAINLSTILRAQEHHVFGQEALF